ncbi:ABC transporter substrate-binding protein [Salipiger sp. 1_MG-2023]|uniref:MlaC/ttg2D family ABC transporter substrate-binding protein n=1 Tax=Salipiger sp. 1_MG-2023 TaxID=3062665 RepID=UPI0026E19C28|nr:ABC transporter substrate-binding protein [Salipiger sp. 1_MG-2023]MDO6586348.1 ABC transporter substrate-binding protein [Salipiger sp. 1_MG-2023]
MRAFSGSTMTRRAMITGAVSAVALTLIGAPAHATSAAQAEALVDRLVGDINTAIGSGASEAKLIAQFEQIFRSYGDMPYIAAYAMGVEARRASPAQKKAFTEAFSSYISRKYGKQFRKFIGGRIDVQGTKSVKNAYQVSTLAYLRGQSPFDVTFFIGEKSGKFFNLYVEGVNMLLTERTEIGSMLDRRGGDIDAMIADLRRAG